MSDLQKQIQEKKESKDYLSLKMGLDSELKCFEAIQMLGVKKTQLKTEINSKLKSGVDPNSSEIKSLIGEASQIHYLQSQVVNDVCKRFEVIHPDILEKSISPELLKYKQRYWDWYSDMYYKYYGYRPEIIK